MAIVACRDLPPPLANKSGWPWTEESEKIPETMPDGRPWPWISIVTPSYNQGQFIEETIRSVLLQGYPNAEYIVIDGGSTDNSVEIIQKYEPWLTQWVSEPDEGQSHAINKGLEHCTGSIFNWINSDDQLAPGALAEVARIWSRTNPHLIAGGGVTVDANSHSMIKDWEPRPPKQPIDFVLDNRISLSQPSTFLSLQLFRQMGGLRQELHYVLDWELYLRCTLHLRTQFRTVTTSSKLSLAQDHPNAKTQRAWQSFSMEWIRVLKEYRKSFSRVEWLGVIIRIRQILLHLQITAALTTSNPSVWNLVRIALEFPEATCSRSYWGVMRRLVFGHRPHRSIST